MKFIKNNQNYKQKITVITSFFVEFISISISSLAFWFIPQSIEYNLIIVIIINNYMINEIKMYLFMISFYCIM
jgi:hypothetical protein